MPELDFAGLRGEVETATRVPEFTVVEQRSVRARTRDRAARLAIGLTTLAVLSLAGLAGVRAAPGPIPNPAGPPVTDPYQPNQEPSPQAYATTVYSIAGLDRTSLYAAVDVCLPNKTIAHCSLQVIPLGISAQDQRNPIATGELRDSPTDVLSGVSLSVLSPRSMLLSGFRQGGKPVYRRITIGGAAANIAGEMADNAGPQPGDRLVQISRYGEPYYVRQTDDQVIRLPASPNLTNPVVIASTPPTNGWWVTGTDAHGDVTVAASQDRGARWSVNSLGVRPGLGEPAFATADGGTAYLFVNSGGAIRQFRTQNRGESWQELFAQLPWPFGPDFDPTSHSVGAVVRTDGSILLWLEDKPGIVYLESTDRGETFHPADGPGGPIIAIGDGFVTITDPPRVSRDARNWTALPRPPAVLPTS